MCTVYCSYLCLGFCAINVIIQNNYRPTAPIKFYTARILLIQCEWNNILRIMKRTYLSRRLESTNGIAESVRRFNLFGQREHRKSVAGYMVSIATAANSKEQSLQTTTGLFSDLVFTQRIAAGQNSGLQQNSSSHKTHNNAAVYFTRLQPPFT